MAFGIQTFMEDGSVDFDTNSPHLRVIHRQTVTGSTSITIQDYSPPFFVIVLAAFTDGVSSPQHVSPVTHNQSGNTVNIVFHVYEGYWTDDSGAGYRPSVNLPATVLVCK